MPLKRIIPQFLLRGERLVKGTHFSQFLDVGDPISQARIYDAQGADEIVITDIDASRNGRLISREIISDIAQICRLPIAAGGGIRTVDDAMKCFNAGADKIIINSASAENTNIIRQLSDEFGSQSVLASVDVKKEKKGNYRIFTEGGSHPQEMELHSYIEDIISKGCGELLLTSITQEGTLSGFDLPLYQQISDIVSVPFIAAGGAGSYDDMVFLFNQTPVDACAIGKMLFLRDYDIVRIKAYLHGRGVKVRDS